MKPPYEVTGRVLKLIASISEQIGEIKAAKLIKPPTELRKRNRIKTIQSSLEIEGNTMNIQQITDLINDKRVLAPKKDILEVKNALQVYSILNTFEVFKTDSLCEAHKILMKGLMDRPGQLRKTSVGIVKDEDLTHIAPPGDMVYPLLQNLFDYLKNDDDLLLIKSCVFHYEFKFIHPFLDGNGRMGRLWQTLILRRYSPVFEFLPIETLVKERQKDYYGALSKSDSQGSSTSFVEFMLEILHLALEDLLLTQNLTVKDMDRIDLFRSIIGNKEFSRQEYLRHNKGISPPTASRDLKNAVGSGILSKFGDKRLTRYRFNLPKS
ncbi:Fic family protein [Reichenbachiella sp. MALMAid0571]|uniref:Fic family protein n=1 Tax=Reichenbachiella sp. MALMAid0571 TaxID=3143939 RepID=UPI0032DF3AD3